MAQSWDCAGQEGLPLLMSAGSRRGPRCVI